MSNKRQLIVVDVETTGLIPGIHVPLEVAAINVNSGDVIHFAPYLDPADLAKADPDALRVSRYFERGVYQHALTWDASFQQYCRLWDMLRGNTFAGANPRFDVGMLLSLPTAEQLGGEVWHYRLPDVSSYVGGALGIDPAELDGLAGCCDRLGVINDCEHSALGDAKAAAECFQTITRRYGAKQHGAKQ